MNFSRNKVTILISTGTLVLLFGMSLYQMSQEVIIQSGQVIVDDIARLQAIFSKIDTQCGIMGFAHERNYIDFLNVHSFEGSEVGAMNLANAQGWRGPYVLENPVSQGYVYEIIRTAEGYYIVPGSGVLLPDGRQMGTNILVYQSDGVTAKDPVRDLKSLVWNGHDLYAHMPIRNLRNLAACTSPEDPISD